MLKLKIVLAAVIYVSNINYGQHTDQINSTDPKPCLPLQSESQLSWKQVFTEQKTTVFRVRRYGFGLDLTLRYGALLRD
jgi:hypothetical protein